MNAVSIHEVELLALLRERPKFAATIEALLKTINTETNINLAEVAARSGLQEAGAALLTEWAQPLSEHPPLPKARRHSKKK